MASPCDSFRGVSQMARLVSMFLLLRRSIMETSLCPNRKQGYMNLSPHGRWPAIRALTIRLLSEILYKIHPAVFTETDSEPFNMTIHAGLRGIGAARVVLSSQWAGFLRNNLRQ